MSLYKQCIFIEPAEKSRGDAKNYKAIADSPTENTGRGFYRTSLYIRQLGSGPATFPGCRIAARLALACHDSYSGVSYEP
jgi:hypothetical protein